jgi:hypothetical protein
MTIGFDVGVNDDDNGGTRDSQMMWNGTVNNYNNTSAFGDMVLAADTTPPSAPSGLSASSVSPSQINLAWTASTDNVGVTGYRVDRCQGAGCTSFVQIATLSSTSYSDTGLSANTSYTYRVRAADAIGNLSGYSSNATATTASVIKSITVDKTSSAITVNGVLAESAWNLATSVTKSVINTGNNTVTFDAVWDNTYLYLSAKVLDATLNNDSTSIGDDDSVEFYIDANNSGSTSYDPTDFKITKGYNDTSLSITGGNTTGILHSSATTTGGYIVEIAVPWSRLGVTPTVNMTIGFDVGVNDDDNGGSRDSQMMWNGTSFNYTNTANFGDATLASSNTICVQTPLTVSSAFSDGGYAYLIPGSFGTPADNSSFASRSTLRLFENGLEIGPAHSSHADIRNLGLGRFSHWAQTDGTGESIRFSASNNTNPRTNGRSYTYCVDGATP